MSNKKETFGGNLAREASDQIGFWVTISRFFGEVPTSDVDSRVGGVVELDKFVVNGVAGDLNFGNDDVSSQNGADQRRSNCKKRKD